MIAWLVDKPITTCNDSNGSYISVYLELLYAHCIQYYMYWSCFIWNTIKVVKYIEKTNVGHLFCSFSVKSMYCVSHLHRLCSETIVFLNILNTKSELQKSLHHKSSSCHCTLNKSITSVQIIQIPLCSSSLVLLVHRRKRYGLQQGAFTLCI